VASTGANNVDVLRRHILVDSGGLLVATVVTPANVQDLSAVRIFLRTAKPIAAQHRPRMVRKGLYRYGSQSAAVSCLCGPNRKIAALVATATAANAITGATVKRVSVAPMTAPPHMISTTL
jgi:hypothetical protein